MDLDAITVTLLRQTLRAWQKGRKPPDTLATLDCLPQRASVTPIERIYLLHGFLEEEIKNALCEQRRVEALSFKPVTNPTRAGLLKQIRQDFAVNNSELEAWSALYHRYLVPIPFDVETIADAIPITQRHFRRRVALGLQRMVDRLRRLELAAHQKQREQRLRRYVPAAEYATLFGVDSLLQRLISLLELKDGPRFISIEGLGGIGKTALARAAAQRLAKRATFEDIAWISARQTWFNDQGEIARDQDGTKTLDDLISRLVTQLGQNHLAGLATREKLTRLQPLLYGKRQLIVIDNLETISDVDAVMKALLPLIGETRILLTSRESPHAFSQVHRFPVPELSLTNSKALVESELRRHSRGVLLEPAEIGHLYDLVGGFPLALKLVAAHLCRTPFSTIASGLQLADRRAPQRLYFFIYRRIWDLLTAEAQELLFSFLSVSPEGEDVPWLRLVTVLPDEKFDEALKQLQSFSLLETSGPADAPRFRLHRLTSTFLQTEILVDWGESSDNQV